MIDSRYFGTYAEATCPDKKMVGLLMGADTLVGEEFEIFFKIEDDGPIAWVRNKFGDEIGYFNRNMSYRLSVIKADGWAIKAMLAFVGISGDEDSHYFAMMGIIANSPRYDEEIAVFAKKVSEKLCEGVRPDLDLAPFSIDEMIKAKGNWLPSKNKFTKKLKGGSSIMKGSRSNSEKLIEQGRAGNKGCYAIAWAFNICLVVLVVLLIKWIMGF